MSRSCWALAETRRRGALVHVAGGLRRFEGGLRLESRLLPSAVSATKYAVVLLAAGVLVIAAEPARALASSRPDTQAQQQAQPVVLALGSGYAGGNEAARVRSLQRRLQTAGFSPGRVDGRYGTRTEGAVEMFQGAHGLRADGIAGPLTLAALRTPSSILYPGAGYLAAGSRQVRGLQRQLRRDGYDPGPIDGRYGPLTEGAVRRFQSAHGLRVDGIAGSHTFGELMRIAAVRHPATRPRAKAPRPRTSRPRPSQTRSPKPARPGTPQAPRHRAAGGERRGSASRPGAASSPLVVVLAGLLVLAALATGVWLTDRRRRRRRTVAAQPAGAKTPRPEAGEGAPVPEEGYGLEQYWDVAVAELVYRQGDEHGDPVAASNLGIVLEHRGDIKGAEAAYRRADERGSSAGAFNLAGLLLARGDVDEAIAAYRRADMRGDPGAAATLGPLLLKQGDQAGAEDAFARADARGDPTAAADLGVLLERRGDIAGAEAAYRRADDRGDAGGAFNLGALLERRGDRAAAAAAYERADQRGDAAGALKLGMLLERQGDLRVALAAYQRAQQSDRPQIAEVARSRAEALALGLSLVEKGER